MNTPLNPFPRRALLGLAIASALGLGSATQAQTAPKGKVILTISGKVAGGQPVAFDLAMLEALPQKTFTTQTPWDNAPLTFTGPLLRDVLAAAKVQGQQLKAVALNDYKVAIPAGDAKQFDMVLAHRMNGQPIPVRTKGPLFIVYPYDSAKALQSNTYYERSIWQLKAIEVE